MHLHDGIDIRSIPFFSSYDSHTGRLTLRGATHIPSEIFQLSEAIRILDISGWTVSSLPEDFSSLDLLSAVFLWDNDFSEFPRVLSECTWLKLISFKNGKLTHISEDVFPPSLEWLVLTNNPDITRIPDSIGELGNLRKLALTGTGISHLPESLKECKNLEFLRIAACQFTYDFPSWIQDFPKLAWFAGAGNPISTIPSISNTFPEFDESDIEIGECINESQSSIVSHAYLRSMGKSVVVKVFKDTLTSDGFPIDDMRASFALGQHPNIVHVLGIVNSRNSLILLSEPIPETYTKLWLPPSLESCTRDTYSLEVTFSLHFIMTVLQDISSACEHIHSLWTSHGDLYAHNILVDLSGHAILCDFWAATFYDRVLHPEYEHYDLRALGHLIGELLERVEETDISDGRVEILSKIRIICLSEEQILGYTFSEVVSLLKKYWENPTL